MRRRVTVLAVTLGLLAWTAGLPWPGTSAISAPRDPGTKARGNRAAAANAVGNNLQLLGSSNLGGGGMNGEVAVVGNTAVVAVGFNQDTIPQQHFYGFTNDPYSCPAATVKVVDLSNPTAPAVTDTIAVEAGVVALDVAAIPVTTPTFTGHLAAVALARCNAAGSLVNRGVAYYNVSNPADAVFLGRYDTDAEDRTATTPPCGPPPGGSGAGCAQSEWSVHLVQRPSDGKVISLSTQPFCSASGCRSGDMRVVDATNPTTPVQVGSWPLGADVPVGNSASGRKGWSKNGCRPIETGQTAEATADGLQALFAYQDRGMFTLDITNPGAPTKIGETTSSADQSSQIGYDRSNRADEAGTAGYVSAMQLGAQSLALLSEEDWVAPSTRLNVSSPASLAGSKFACEAMFTLFDPEDTAQLYRKPGASISGDIAYLGRGCPQVGLVSTPDPYLQDPSGKIALIDHTRDPVTQPAITPTGGIGCGYDLKAKRAQDAGATAVVIRRMGAVPEALSESGNPKVGTGAGLTIPVIQIDKTDGDAMRATICPAVDATGACTGGTPVTAAMQDSAGEWGGLKIIDNTNPAAPAALATYRPPTAAVFPPPDLGVYSVHHAVPGPGNRAYVAANSDGLRVLDLNNPSAPAEVASFVPPDTPDPTNQIPGKAYVVGVAAYQDKVVISDINSGLYVLGFPKIVTGAGQGGGPHVRVFAADGTPAAGFFPYPLGFTGGVRVATGDVTPGGNHEIVTGAGPGGGPHVRVFNSSGAPTPVSFFAFGPAFRGGVFVASGNVNAASPGDEIIAGAGEGGGPHVRVFSANGMPLSDFFPYPRGFPGGVRVAVADINGDGVAEIVTGAGPGGGPHVRVFNGDGSPTPVSFFPYPPGFPGGVFVTGRSPGAGAHQIVTGAGEGGGPHVRVFNGDGSPTPVSFFPYPLGFSGGVRVGGGDVTAFGPQEIVTVAGPGGGPHVRAFDATGGPLFTSFFAYGAGFRGGAYVAAGPLGP